MMKNIARFLFVSVLLSLSSISQANARNSAFLQKGNPPSPGMTFADTLPIWQAVRTGNSEIVTNYLDNGGDAKVLKDGRTLLMEAAEFNQVDIAWLLVNGKVDIEAKDPNGQTALMYAAKFGNPEVLNSLLGWRPKLEAVDNHGKTALMLANEIPEGTPMAKNKAAVVKILTDTRISEEQERLAALSPPALAIKQKDKTRRKITDEERGPTLFYERGKNSYYGLKDTAQSYTEAYYWFSVCAYSTANSGIRSEKDYYKRAYAFSRTAALEGNNKYLEDQAMVDLLVSPELKKICGVYLKTLNKKLSEAERSSISPRLEEWKEKHPLTTLTPPSPEEEKRIFLLERLAMEIEGAAADGSYDMEGINALIAAGADVKSAPHLIKISTDKGLLDIFEALIKTGAVNDPAIAPPQANVAQKIPPILNPNQAADHPANGLSSKAIARLRSRIAEEKNQTIEEIKKNPGAYNPPALSQMAEVYLQKFKDEDGLFWYMAAELRSNIDHHICKRPTSSLRNGLSFSKEIQYYAKLYPEKFQQLLPKVLEWDRATPYKYNLQWGESSSTCLSKDRYDEIREGTREDFQNSYERAVKDPYKKVFMDDLIPLAESGDKKAQFELGSCYNSRTCEKPYEDLQLMLDHQAKQELAQEGQSTKIYSGTDTKDEDKEKAFYWLRKSADQSYGPAYLQLASMYALPNDKDTVADPRKACEMILAAIKLGEFKAYNMMTRIAGPKENPERIIEEYAWAVVSNVAAGEKMPVIISPYTSRQLSDTELKLAKERAQLYIKEHVELGKPVCLPTDL